MPEPRRRDGCADVGLQRQEVQLAVVLRKPARHGGRVADDGAGDEVAPLGRQLLRGEGWRSERRQQPSAARGPHSAARNAIEIALFLLRVADRVAPIVEIDELAQRRGRAVREVRRPRREPAKLLHDDRADVVALARDERPPGVLRVDDAAEKRMRRDVGVARDLEQRQLRSVASSTGSTAPRAPRANSSCRCPSSRSRRPCRSCACHGTSSTCA